MEYQVNSENFNEEVLNANKTVLVDFYADWCGPCRMLAPILAQIAEEREDVKVCKVNVDKDPALANMYKVSSIPLVVVIKDGNVVAQSLGYKTKEAILALL